MLQCSRVDGTLATMPDEIRHDASDTARPSAIRYSLSLDETAVRFVEAGLPRNIRSLQRYCAAGRLDCINEDTVRGLAYFVKFNLGSEPQGRRGPRCGRASASPLPPRRQVRRGTRLGDHRASPRRQNSRGRGLYR